MAMPRAMPGPRETLHVAMAAIIAHTNWWELPMDQAVAVAMTATSGAASPAAVQDEFKLMLKDRGIYEANKI